VHEQSRESGLLASRCSMLGFGQTARFTGVDDTMGNCSIDEHKFLSFPTCSLHHLPLVILTMSYTLSIDKLHGSWLLGSCHGLFVQKCHLCLSDSKFVWYTWYVRTKTDHETPSSRYATNHSQRESAMHEAYLESKLNGLRSSSANRKWRRQVLCIYSQIPEGILCSSSYS